MGGYIVHIAPPPNPIPEIHFQSCITKACLYVFICLYERETEKERQRKRDKERERETERDIARHRETSKDIERQRGN